MVYGVRSYTRGSSTPGFEKLTRRREEGKRGNESEREREEGRERKRATERGREGAREAFQSPLSSTVP